MKIELPTIEEQKTVIALGEELERVRSAATPNIDEYNPDPDYLRSLVERSGLSQREVARRVGVSERTMRDYLNSNHKSAHTYPVQFTIEMLVESLEQ